MAKLLHFVSNKDGRFHEFVYIMEGTGTTEDVEKEYAEDGYELSGTIDLDDSDLGGFPTERMLD